MNNIFLIGIAGKDAERREKFVSFTLATSEKIRETDKFQTEWHNCLVASKFLIDQAAGIKKGDKIAVQGKINYKEKDGKHYVNIYVQGLVVQSKGAGGRNEHDDIPF